VDQRAVVERARRGDHDAFAVLAVAAVPRLDRLARLIVRDPDLAQDAVQESVIRAWRDLPGLRDPDRFDAWLQRLTVRACLALAKAQRRRAIEVDLGDLQPPADVDVAHGVAERDLVDAALRRLEPDRRALVVLHVYAGVPLPEVAEALGIPLGTAKSRLARALAALRVAMPSEEDGPMPVAIPDGGAT
jgi:RNA polymerase sigma-70 factor (ECF subfamily)